MRSDTVAMTGTVTASLRRWPDLRGVWLGEETEVKVLLADGKLKDGRQSMMMDSGDYNKVVRDLCERVLVLTLMLLIQCKRLEEKVGESLGRSRDLNECDMSSRQ